MGSEAHNKQIVEDVPFYDFFKYSVTPKDTTLPSVNFDSLGKIIGRNIFDKEFQLKKNAEANSEEKQLAFPYDIKYSIVFQEYFYQCKVLKTWVCIDKQEISAIVSHTICNESFLYFFKKDLGEPNFSSYDPFSQAKNLYIWKRSNYDIALSIISHSNLPIDRRDGFIEILINIQSKDPMSYLKRFEQD